MLCNILQYHILTYIYIKELHNTNVFNTIKKALNHRMCYTDSYATFACSISKLNT